MADIDNEVEELSPQRQRITDYLNNSLMLSTPLISNDPAYQQLQGDMQSIIDMSLLSMGKEDAETLTPSEQYIVGLKCLYTIYLRLATSSAPEFDVSAEQVSFKKGDRFFHYTSLADKVAEELEDVESSTVEIADIRISSRNGTLRNYNLSQSQKVNLKANVVTDHSAELSWNMFSLTYGEFYKYTLLYGKSEIYDEYSIPRIKKDKGTFIKDFYDIKRTKLRISELDADTKYYVVVIFHNRDGGKSIEQIDFQTEKPPEEDTDIFGDNNG